MKWIIESPKGMFSVIKFLIYNKKVFVYAHRTSYLEDARYLHSDGSVHDVADFDGGTSAWYDTEVDAQKAIDLYNSLNPEETSNEMPKV